MKSKLQNCKVEVYVDEFVTNEHESFAGYSFTTDDVQSMTYPEFLSNMSRRPTGMTLKTGAPCATKVLEKEIIYPEFYHELGDFDGLELTQAQIFTDNAHYDKFDQFVCAMDGQLDMRLVPHVYR